MGILNFGKKKGMEEVIQSKDLRKVEFVLKILGGGCSACNELERNVKMAMVKLGVEAEIEHITDFAVIASYGVMSTPALVIDQTVVSYGKILKEQEAVNIIKKYIN